MPQKVVPRRRPRTRWPEISTPASPRAKILRSWPGSTRRRVGGRRRRNRAVAAGRRPAGLRARRFGSGARRDIGCLREPFGYHIVQRLAPRKTASPASTSSSATTAQPGHRIRCCEGAPRRCARREDRRRGAEPGCELPGAAAQYPRT
jgi:hypothetical protein